MIPRLTLLGGSGLGLLAAVAALAGAPATAAGPGGRHLVAVKAGTIHVVDGDRVVHDGTILIQGNAVLAVGEDVDVPPDAQVVDYGPDAHVVPGLVAAFSGYASGPGSKRTAEPGLSALDGFDFERDYASALANGVTTVYVTPAEGRLVAGTGALVKLAGADAQRRTVRPLAAIHGAVDDSARHTPGYWEPPLPSTIDNELGYFEPQLPSSTMGAIVALDELIEVTRTGERGTIYGPYVPGDLAPLLAAGVPWRLTAVEPNEIRAVLTWAQANGRKLIVDKASGLDETLAHELAATGASVVFRVPFHPNSPGRDQGRDEDDRWSRYDVPSLLAEAGVPFAIASASPVDLLFAAAAASRHGLEPAAALRAITQAPAAIHGAAGRVGSLSPGHDADLCVLNDDPISGQASVLATWVDGEVVWKAKETSGVVVEVDELFVGDGRVLRPGQVLMQDGRIAEVGERVSHPKGALVVRGRAAMPGMIDALGYLGLEGSKKVPGTDFHMSQIVGPGDPVDRRVARTGVTTVVLSPRGSSKSGAPVLAYKPAAEELDTQVVADPAALRLAWTQSNRLESGNDVRKLLSEAAEYRQERRRYLKELAEWERANAGHAAPQEAGEEKETKAEEGGEEKKEEAGEEQGDDAKKSKKKRKKGEEEELEPDPVTGVWEAELARAPSAAPAPLKFRIELEGGKGSGAVTGNLRSTAVSEDLVDLEGWWDREENSLRLKGLGSMGWVGLEARVEEKKLLGTVEVGGTILELEATRLTNEFKTASRPEQRAEKSSSEKPPKGKPKEVKEDAKLEPLVAAMEGRASVIVEVDREDEVRECVHTFSRFGIRPVLLGARGAEHAVGVLRDHVAGVLLSPTMIEWKASRGTDYRTPYSELQNAGIPVAFHSAAEEGAADLPVMAEYAVSRGMSPEGALRALTSDAAAMMAIDARVGRLERGHDADVLLLDGPPLAPGTSVERVWVNGIEVR